MDKRNIHYHILDILNHMHVLQICMKWADPKLCIISNGCMANSISNSWVLGICMVGSMRSSCLRATIQLQEEAWHDVAGQTNKWSIHVFPIMLERCMITSVLVEVNLDINWHVNKGTITYVYESMHYITIWHTARLG